MEINEGTSQIPRPIDAVPREALQQLSPRYGELMGIFKVPMITAYSLISQTTMAYLHWKAAPAHLHH